MRSCERSLKHVRQLLRAAQPLLVPLPRRHQQQQQLQQQLRLKHLHLHPHQHKQSQPLPTTAIRLRPQAPPLLSLWLWTPSRLPLQAHQLLQQLLHLLLHQHLHLLPLQHQLQHQNRLLRRRRWSLHLPPQNRRRHKRRRKDVVSLARVFLR